MKRFLVAILICFPLFVYSQADFRPAYIIGFNNDTTYGLINYNANVYYNCEFKKSPESEIVVYKPFEISAYRFIDDKYYISKKVTVKNSYEKVNNVEFYNHDKEEVITSSHYKIEGSTNQKVFLEYLVQGESNLYYLKDNHEIEHYFLDNKDSTLIDLANEVVETFHNGQLYGQNTSNLYIGKIKATMRACPQLFDKIDNVELNHKEMIDLTSKYHDYICKDHKCIIYERKIIPPSFHFSIFGGIAFEKTNNLRLYNLYDSKYLNFNNCLTPSFGAKLHIRSIYPEKERFSIKISTELLISNYKKPINIYGGSGTIKYNVYYANTSISGVHNFTTKVNSPYFEYGLLLKYSFGDKLEGSNNDIIFRRYHYPFNYGAVIGLGYETAVFGNSKKVFTELAYKQLFNEYYLNFMVGFEF